MGITGYCTTFAKVLQNLLFASGALTARLVKAALKETGYVR